MKVREFLNLYCKSDQVVDLCFLDKEIIGEATTLKKALNKEMLNIEVKDISTGIEEGWGNEVIVIINVNATYLKHGS